MVVEKIGAVCKSMYPYQLEGGAVDSKNAEEQPFLLRNTSGQKFGSPSRQKYFNGDYAGQWPDETSQRNEMIKENACVRACTNCIFPGRTFSEEWEQLADSFIHPLDRQRMSLALFLLFTVVSSLSVIELVYQAAITVQVMCNMVFAFCFITMFIFVCTRYCKQRHFLFVRIMTYLSVYLVACLHMPYKLPFAKDSGFFSPGDRLWELFFVILVVYVFIPLPYLLCLIVGVLLPVGFATTTIFQLEHFRPTPDMYSVAANLVLLAGAGNIIGLVAWCIWNRFTRRLLVHVREYALAGVELEKENEKFDRVLTACFPPTISASLKADILNGVADCATKEKIVNHESVTMMLVELVGFDRLLMGTPPRDKGVIVNKLFAKLCELSEGYACACLNADSGWTLLVVSGIVHSRSDHARACLHLAFDMLDFVNALSDTAGVPLRLRMTVHSGSIACGLIGKQRWVYDAWSHDLVTAQRMHESAVVGQVQISRETLAFFGNASDIQLSQEPNVVAAAAIADRFVVRPNRPPRLYGFSDVLSSYPDRHLLAPTQLLIAALDSTSPLNCNQYPLFGQTLVRPSPIQLLTTPVRLPDEEAFALSSVRQLQDDVGSSWTVPTVIPNQIHSEMDNGTIITITKSSLSKRDILNPFTMRFRNRILEHDFEESPTSLFTVSLVSCLSIHVASTIFHCLVLPKTILFLTLALFTFINFLTPLFTMVCNKLGCVSIELQRSSRLRLCFCIICLVLSYLTAQLNVLTCSGGMFDAIFIERPLPSSSSLEAANIAKHRQCAVPVYIGAAGLLIICMPILFTRILALVKAAFALMVALGFALVIEYTHRSLFVRQSSSVNQFTPSDLPLLVSLAIFVVFVYVHGRLLDRLERVTLLWQRTCAERHIETAGISQNCRRLLNNILPEQALSCLVDSAIPIDSYSENQDNVAVAVLSLENLPQASSLERRLNSTKTLDSFRLLSQLIFQIDELLNEGRFKDLVKVRSVGSQYVIAVGLYSPENGAPETVVSQRLSVAIDFVLAVRQMVVMTNSSLGSEITVHSGISIGSVTCGVIACRTIYFDIFSNTVRTALQMSRTCKPEYVQVSETVYTYTRYLYRYYSRKRMSVDPIGEFFAYRLIGTRAMYRNGPLGLGPLIGSGLTRQGSRESGVSLLSQATSVWSQAGGPQNRQLQSYAIQQQQQRLMADSISNRLIHNSAISYASSAAGEEGAGDSSLPMSNGQVPGSIQSDQTGHYASTTPNSSYSYYAGPSVVSQGPYQYASAFVPPFREGGRNANMSQLSAVPEMDASGHEQVSITMGSSNTSNRFDLSNSQQMENNVAPIKEDEFDRAEDEYEQKKQYIRSPSKRTSGGPIDQKKTLASSANGNSTTIKSSSTAESGQNSPRSQVSHYDNQNGNSNGSENDVYLQSIAVANSLARTGDDFDDNGLSEMPEIKSYTLNSMQTDLTPSKKVPDSLFSNATTFSLSYSKPKATSSRQSLQHQFAVDQMDDQGPVTLNNAADVAEIDERLAALDELDRKIRESVAQLRCVEAIGDNFPEEVPAPKAVEEKAQLGNSRHRVSEEVVLEQPTRSQASGIQSIPFIDDSMLTPLNKSNAVISKTPGYVSAVIATPSRHVLPDLVRPPAVTNNNSASNELIGENRVRSRSADQLAANSSSIDMSPMPTSYKNTTEPPSDS